MEPQFQELAREISESVAERVTDAVTERVAVRLTASETSAVEKRLQVHFEAMELLVKLSAEGYGATLDSIDHRLARLEKDWNRNIRLHSKALKNHAVRIDAIEKRS